MANVIVTEYRGTATNVGAAPMQIASGLIASQVVAIGVSSALTGAAFNASTYVIRVYAEANCTVTYGASPTATAANHVPLAAGQYDYFQVEPGWKLAVIARTVS